MFMNEKLTELREKANRLPLLPGVYIMHDRDDHVIYVGKAKKLKNRVSSYFHGEHLPKVAAMVEKVNDFEVIVVDSEFEALMLENSLIKQHMPRYNILLRDDKGYPFVRLNVQADYPTFSVVNRKADDGAVYFGPFGSRGTTFQMLRTLKRAYRLPDCDRKFPRDIGKSRPCLNYQIGACAGYCLPETPRDSYASAITEITEIMNGNAEKMREELTELMQKAAEELNFERAADYRDRLRALESLGNTQGVIATGFSDTDVIGFFRGAKTCFTVLHFAGGDLKSKDFSLMEEPLETDSEAVCRLCIHYYQDHAVPRTLLLPAFFEDADLLAQHLRQKTKHGVTVLTPKRGEKSELTERAYVNAREEVQRATTEQQQRSKKLAMLQDLLLLPTFPHRIEAYDISNTGAFGVVAGMTVFFDGKPLKKAYRKFRIRSFQGQNDYQAMFEVITRRFRDAVEGKEGFEEMPDILLIDGGAEHAKTAERALSDIGLTLPVFGMVKDSHHRTRALTTSDGLEIALSNPAIFSLIGTIQEETHRFAITYHRSLRSADLRSALESVPGIGKARTAALYKQFQTIPRLRNASLEELSAVVPKNAAEQVFAYFHSNGNEPGSESADCIDGCIPEHDRFSGKTDSEQEE